MVIAGAAANVDGDDIAAASIETVSVNLHSGT